MAFTSQDIEGFYKKHLGRGFTDPGEGAGWMNQDGAEYGIANSGEAQAYKAKQNQPQAPTAGAAPAAAAPAPAGGGLGAVGQATAAPSTYNVGAAPPDVAAKVASIIQSKGLQANQSNPMASMGPLVDELRAQGINAQVDYTDSNGHSGGILVDGKPYQLIDGSNRWTPLQPWQDSGSGGGGGGYQAGSVSGTINGSSGNQSPEVTAAVQAAILKQLGTLQNPTDPNSGTVKAITDPYHLQSQRGLEDTRRALAEQAYANGNMNTGGYAGQQIKAVEDAGAAEANFTGQTVATQEAQRQQMLMQMLGLGNNVSQFSQTLSATQKNFAEQLAQQDKQFAATLAQNVAQFGQSMGYQYSLLDWSKQQKTIDGSTTPVPGY